MFVCNRYRAKKKKKEILAAVTNTKKLLTLDINLYRHMTFWTSV